MESHESKVTKKRFLQDFCEFGLKDYNKKLRRAFILKDWALLQEIALMLEKDAYSIGAVDVCGRLIRLRILIDEKNIDPNIIDCTLNSIEECSEKLLEFLRVYIKENIQKNQKKVISRYNTTTDEIADGKRNGWSCIIQ